MKNFCTHRQSLCSEHRLLRMSGAPAGHPGEMPQGMPPQEYFQKVREAFQNVPESNAVAHLKTTLREYFSRKHADVGAVMNLNAEIQRVMVGLLPPNTPVPYLASNDALMTFADAAGFFTPGDMQRFEGERDMG